MRSNALLRHQLSLELNTANELLQAWKYYSSMLQVLAFTQLSSSHVYHKV